MRSALALLVAGACGSHPAATGDAAIDGTTAAPDAAAPSRPALASGGLQLLVTGPAIGLQLTPADLASDVDVIEIHQEFYGVPWDTFAANTAPPAAWVAVMDQLASSARTAGKPVFLSISMLNGGRDHLAALTTITGGQVQPEDGWSAACYDFATAPDGAMYKQAYLRYVNWMIAEFSPRWLDEAIEVNLFFEQCPAATAGVIEVANAAYAAAKAAQPALVVFPSIQIDHLYGYDLTSCPGGADPRQRQQCFDASYAQIAPLVRDRFAMSSYPVLLAGQTVAELPADWFTRGSSRGNEQPVIAETGTNSTAIAVEPRGAACVTLLGETEADTAAYLTRVLADAKAAHMELVNWWSDRDLVVDTLMTDCPCTFDATWCAALDAFRGPPTTSGPDTQLEGELALKAFGTMGLRSYDGTMKPAVYPIWQAARANP